MGAVKGGGFFYGWVIVGALFLINMVPMVLVSNYASFFQVPICEELGVSYAGFMLGTMTGPTFAATIRTVTGSYEMAWAALLAVAVLLGVCAIAAIFLGKKLPERWHA